MASYKQVIFRWKGRWGHALSWFLWWKMLTCSLSISTSIYSMYGIINT